MDTFVPLPVDIFFYLFFWTNATPSSLVLNKNIRQYNYTVSNEKHDVRLPPFFLFLISFLLLIIYFLLVSVLCIFVYLCI